ncbi:hypothetical protein GQ53DRAFT_508252 [Thozetella sp. PMI_491]|nr:hypothetical protein GQ53DRAFT_508252 [Thozetella sp. PMI_491]
MSAATQDSDARHICHCGKRFLRKEHLRRHEATHREPSFVCPVCQRSFTRNDLLRRHLAHHEPKADPEPRIRQACQACHANKTRCDGGFPCVLCNKRGIECVYNPSQAVGAEALAESSTLAGPVISFSSSPNILSARSRLDSESNPLPSSPERDIPANSHPELHMHFVLEALNSSRRSLDGLLEDSDDDDLKAWSTNCLDAFLKHFHIHWPILHGPRIDVYSDPLTISASVLMVGHWLTYPESSAAPALAVHQKLVDIFLNELCKPAAVLKRDQPWQFEEYQPIVLNIVFAFYSNREELIARATMLLSLFITALRQAGFFSSKAAAYQEKIHFPGTFLPFIISNRQQRARYTSPFSLIGNVLTVGDFQASWHTYSKLTPTSLFAAVNVLVYSQKSWRLTC